MESRIIEVKENHGDGRIKVKVFSHEVLTEEQVNFLSTMTRDEVLKYGTLQGWKVIDISDWV